MNKVKPKLNKFPIMATEDDDHMVLLLDGSFASQLSLHVDCKVDGDPLWTARFLANDREAVVKTSLDFLRAGAEIISTNSYQASIDGFMKYLEVSEAEALNYIVDSVNCAKEAVNLYQEEIEKKITMSNGASEKSSVANKYPLIAGSVGPYGASLHDGSEYGGEYVETVSMEEMANWHRPRMKALVGAGVDLLAIETIPALEEAKALLQLLTKEFPYTMAWLSFSSQDGERTSHGDDILTVVEECCALGGKQLIAIGANCLSPKLASSFLVKMSSSPALSVPLIVYPNSGEIWDPEKGWLEGQQSEPMEDYVSKWLALGARYIGGCCRTTCKELEAIKREIDAWNQSQKKNHNAK
ncbi:hypothetical protein J437_LFUL002123 [Ladona fulva]|uniref:Hcy-binding domain-containing protein n=1 Tax=Ladona fulva TaxID=123851 RepID=A0A8K0NU87_LADFU|nr:hypothetical protein J437_LFUL002123 [Ladona fulva]